MTAERKPTLCIVAGPNGSGKTSTTTLLLQNEWTTDSVYINPDNIAQEVYGDWNSPEAILKAAEEATRLRYECLEKGRDFVFHLASFSAPPMEFWLNATRTIFPPGRGGCETILNYEVSFPKKG